VSEACRWGHSRSSARLGYRSATTVDVSSSGREIEVIVMPYESGAPVLHEGRMSSAVCDRRAFDGAALETCQIRVNLAHVRERTVGRVTWLDPSNALGLLATLRIARPAWATRRWRSRRTSALMHRRGSGRSPNAGRAHGVQKLDLPCKTPRASLGAELASRGSHHGRLDM
jgi:hypothetical protein